MLKLMIGFLSGSLATLPMTVWMLGLNRTVPTSKPDPLPPEEITLNIVKKAEMEPALSRTQEKGLSLLNHFLYGGLIAMPFGLIMMPFEGSTRKVSVSRPKRAVPLGIGYGLLVWLGNYLGLLPTLNLYRPATQEPPRMNAIMITAHVLWGGVLGLLANQFSLQVKREFPAI